VYAAVERVPGRKLRLLGQWTQWGCWGGGSRARGCLILNRMSGAVAEANGRVILTRCFPAWSGCCCSQMGTDGGRHRAPGAGGGGGLFAPTFAYQVRFVSWLRRRGMVGARRRGVGAGPVTVFFDIVADLMFGLLLPPCCFCQYVGPTNCRASQGRPVQAAGSVSRLCRWQRARALAEGRPFQEEAAHRRPLFFFFQCTLREYLRMACLTIWSLLVDSRHLCAPCFCKGKCHWGRTGVCAKWPRLCSSPSSVRGADVVAARSDGAKHP